MRITRKASLVLLVFGALPLNAFAFERDSDILGVWINADYMDGSTTYLKHEDFEAGEPGVKLLKNGTLVKRQNSGFCGTSPISYKNYEGTWSRTSESTITIRYDFWGGSAEEDSLIVNVAKDSLTTKLLEQRFDR